MRVWRKTLLLCMCLTGTATAARADLFELIDARLEWMRDVAAYKHANSLPVEDVAREQTVIAKTLEQAAAAGLDPATTQAFFEAQIEAAKDIQSCWIARWMETEAPAEYRDLKQEVRPVLLDLGGQIIAALPDQTVATSERDGFVAAVQVDCLSDQSRDRMFDALTQVTRLQ
ncbi:gamma subclass chorismate mutase AroQ [Ruegeria sp.]|uniref:gamma subclass chorismate mutase AroQ n=1 Tax=Ruegeria sp. TaxID=1879320 RepID=UPI002322E606|nr:gamma subclass chorismate mutase AroQ [Ruegeria sp.]MDA7964175.1 gamma subclass chorismate mutase AroQ [Ruegeria sp.]